MKNKTVTHIQKAFIPLLFLGILSISAPLLAEDSAPISIAADQMMSTEKTNSVTFKGDVDATQGGLRIRSDEMTVHYSAAGGVKDASGKDVSQQVDKIICTGNVEITRDDWLGTSKKMTYLAKKREILLTGNAKFWQGQNMVAGEKIIYYMDEGRSEVLGGEDGTTTVIGDTPKKKKRVNMTIIQQ